MTIHNFGIWIGATLGRWVENAIEKSACKLTVVSLNRISFSGRLWTHSLSLSFILSHSRPRIESKCNEYWVRLLRSTDDACIATIRCTWLAFWCIRITQMSHITRIDFSLSPLRWIQPINISVSLHTILSSSQLSIRHFVYQMNEVLVRTHQNVLLA